MAVSIVRLKEIGRGVIQGYVSVTSSGRIHLYDSTGKIELIPFEGVLLKPETLYEIHCSGLIIKGCVPVNVQNISAVKDCTRVKFSTAPYVYGIYIKQCNMYIKNEICHVTAFFVGSSSSKAEMAIIYFKSELFWYLSRGQFYSIKSEYKIRLLNGNMINLASCNQPFTITHSVNGCMGLVDNDHFKQFLDPSMYSTDPKTIHFSDLTSSLSGFSEFISVECQIVSTDAFLTSGIVNFVDSKNTLGNISLKPTFSKLPKTFVSGARLKLSNVAVKVLLNGRRMLSVTYITGIALLSIPNSTQQTEMTSDLYTVQTSKLTGLINVIVSVDCILSLSVKTCNEIACKLVVSDGTGSASLHIRDNPVFVETLFAFSEKDREMLAGVTDMLFNKIDCDSTDKIERIFSKVTSVRFYIRGSVKHDISPFLIQTPYNKTFKHPRVHIFPYVIRVLSITDELHHAARVCGTL